MSDSAIPWTAPRQVSLSITNSWSLLRHISIKSVKPSNHLILCHPLLLLPSVFPSIRVLSSESVIQNWTVGQRIGASASASVLLMNIQDWFHLGLTGLISLKPKGLSRVFSNTTPPAPGARLALCGCFQFLLKQEGSSVCWVLCFWSLKASMPLRSTLYTLKFYKPSTFHRPLWFLCFLAHFWLWWGWGGVSEMRG